jgi:hypothetical protein
MNILISYHYLRSNNIRLRRLLPSSTSQPITGNPILFPRIDPPFLLVFLVLLTRRNAIVVVNKFIDIK